VLTPERKAPWHLWLVAIVALLWNGAGAYTIMMAQAGRLYDLEPGEAAYYAAQPVWFVVLTDVALVAALAAALALLLRKRMAVWWFALSLIAIVITNSYEFARASPIWPGPIPNSSRFRENRPMIGGMRRCTQSHPRWSQKRPI